MNIVYSIERKNVQVNNRNSYRMFNHKAMNAKVTLFTNDALQTYQNKLSVSPIPDSHTHIYQTSLWL